MKKLFGGSPHTKFIATATAFILTIAIANSAGSAQLEEARVTQVVNDVKMLLEQGAPRPAVVRDLVRHGNAVRTGTQSRSELTFADLTITRLGANTIFSFKEGTREMTLIDGAILFQVPKGSGGATIRTVGVTAAITGTTGIGEFHPATTSRPQPFSKWLCLEGTFHLYLPNGQSVEVGPGKMVTTDGKSFSKVLTFDIAKLTSTSLFFTGFDQPLASMNLIMLESQNQLASSLLANTTTNPLDPTKIVNVTSQAIVAEETQTSPSSSVSPPPPTPPPPTPPPPTPPPPTPTPSKFGTLTVIASPAPYLISSGTVITTDPSITTNGVTDYGKIYRGPVADGAFSLWAFGSTSAFDTALGVDNFFADPTRFPIAAFKFQSLSLTGNPIIDTSNSGVTKLALIGVNGITSGLPGGTLTFTGLDLLALGTVNGSINLTSDISFQNISVLAMYARGAGSNLMLDSPISNIGNLKLGAEGSIQLTNPGTMSVGEFEATAGNNLTLQIGGSLLLNGKVNLKTLVLPGTTVASGVNLQLNSARDFSNSSTGDLSTFQLTNQGTINQSGNISLGVNGNLNCANGAQIQVNNELDSGVSATHGGTIGGDSSISVSASTVSTGGFLVSLLNENDQGGTGTAGGHIGGAASIAINVNGALTANANNPNVGIEPGIFELFIENYGFGDGSPGGFIGSNASVSIAAASISTAGDFAFAVDNSDGGTIGGAARLNVTAGSMSVDEFSAAIYNGNFTGGTGRFGGQIAGAASITFNVTGALNVAGGTDNDMDEPSAMSFVIDNSGLGDGSPAGSIGSDASINVTAGSISDNGRALRLEIFNGGGGMIGGNASITVAANSISAAGPGPTGTGENLNLLIDNSAAGNIAGSATISLNAGSVSTAGTFNANINNSSGGTIGSDATSNATAANISTAGSLFDTIFNTGGNIGGNANLTFNLTGDLTTQGGASFVIDNNNFGLIGSDATINVAASSISVGGGLDADIFSPGGNIGGSALLSVAISGDIATQGDVTFSIFNNDQGSGAGTIGSDATSNATAANISTAGSLFDTIFNTGGNIGGNANLTFNLTGDLTTQGGASFVIDNNNFGLIGSDATSNVTAANISTAGSLFATIFNTGGNIGGNANLTFTLTGDPGDLTTQGDADFAIGNNGGGHIGGAAEISVTAASLMGNSISAIIDNHDSGSIGSNATVNLNVATISATNGFVASLGSFGTQGGGQIGGNASIGVLASNGINAGGDVSFDLGNSHGGGTPAGSIGGSAMIDVAVTGGDISAGDFIHGTVDNNGGTIGGDAGISLNVSGAIRSQNHAFFTIIFNDDNGSGSGPGIIGGNATIDVNAGGISIGGTDLFHSTIFNEGGGLIEGAAAINFNISGDITTPGDIIFNLSNAGGTIGGGATIDVGAGNITANSLVAQIDNTGGSIGASTEAGAAINMNVSGTANVTTDATVAIYGSDGAGSAAININGGSYNAGGTFLTYIDGDGTITFNNASAHADVLKAGVFGANGALNIGGGTLSADSILKLYAPGSNGQLNFMSNVTLGGNSMKILAANSVTIFNNIVVTIGGPNPADVYTNNANYSGSGGNGTTTGTFAGAGANNPQPLENAPPFGPPPPAPIHTRTGIHPPPPVTTGVINVSSSDELLALLDDAARGPDGRITIPDSRKGSHGRNASRINAAAYLNAVRRADMRTASSSSPRRSPQ